MASKCIVTVGLLQRLGSCYTAFEASDRQREAVAYLAEKRGIPIEDIVLEPGVPLIDVAWLMTRIDLVCTMQWVIRCVQKAIKRQWAVNRSDETDQAPIVRERLRITARYATLIRRRWRNKVHRDCGTCLDISINTAAANELERYHAERGNVPSLLNSIGTLLSATGTMSLAVESALTCLERDTRHDVTLSTIDYAINTILQRLYISDTIPEMAYREEMLNLLTKDETGATSCPTEQP